MACSNPACKDGLIPLLGTDGKTMIDDVCPDCTQFADYVKQRKSSQSKNKPGQGEVKA